MLVKNFKQLSKSDVIIAGGKGASLGEMTQAGIQVPPGFTILAKAFEKFLEETDLNVEIEAILDSVNHKEMHTIKNASEKIEALILEAKMPKDIADEIQKFFKNLNSKYVAVRSSATAEDSASAAWAGQLESYLNTTEENLLENVKKCWASLFTPRAIFYRFEKDLHKQKISVAVVVQKMVESEKSGVVFSVHPVTQDRNQLIIEAGFGLGEAIVSGQITPDSYVVEKQPRRIIDKNVQTQSRGLYRAESGGNKWRDIPKEQGEKQVLSDKEILELSEIILKIESHYGFPCDIEWAFEKGKFYIVQSRPITTISTSGDLKKSNVVSRFKNSLRGREVTKQEGNFSLLLLGTGIGGCLQPFSKKYNFDFGQWIFCVEGKHGIVFFDLGRYVDTTFSVYKKFIDQDGEIEEYSDFKKLWEQTNDLYTSNPPAMLRGLEDNKLEDLIIKSFEIGRGLIGSSVFCESIDETQVKTYYRQIDSEGDFGTFFTHAAKPVFDSFALRADKSILQNPHSPELQYVLCDYYLAPATSEVNKKIGDLISERGGLEKISEEADRIQNEIIENKKAIDGFRLSLNEELSDLFDFMQISMYIRDIRRDPLQKVFTVLSNAIREFFYRKGIRPEDAAFGLYSDFLHGLHKSPEYSQEIERRKKQGVTVFFSDEEIIFEYGEVKEKAQALFKAMDKGTSLRLLGNVAYQGSARGVVKIILNENDFPKFRTGEILVTSMTRPEFVPLMKKAAAVITDEGGITCHAAIVSRELKIPCIIGTKNATRVLNDGDFVEIDAENGTVTILK